MPLTPIATHVVLLAATVVSILVPVIISAHGHDRTAQVERRLAMQSWQIEQLLPEGVAFPGSRASVVE